jgi:1,4-alpha-glucan branching enzyme
LNIHREGTMFTKSYLKTKPVCKVTFKVLKKNIGSAETVKIIGEFNDWNLSTPAMKKLKNGDFSTVIDLDTGKAYQFRYLVDDKKWVNDENADAYLPSPFPGVDNSVIAL